MDLVVLANLTFNTLQINLKSAKININRFSMQNSLINRFSMQNSLINRYSMQNSLIEAKKTERQGRITSDNSKALDRFVAMLPSVVIDDIEMNSQWLINFVLVC